MVLKQLLENSPNSKNYKLQNTNYKQITMSKITNRKTEGSHGLPKDSFRLQTMTALIKSFCGGVQGGQFFQKAPPLTAGGRRKLNGSY
jgi:hypothetical protein